MPKPSMVMGALVGIGLAGTIYGETVRAADCTSLLARFNTAVQARSLEDAKKAESAIAGDAVCGASLIQVQNTRAALELVIAEALPANSPQREALTVDADKPQVSWKAAAVLGAQRFEQRRFADAAGTYMRAIEIIKDATKTPHAPAPELINEILDRATQARLLAANEQAPGSVFVASAKDHRDGSVGGVMSEDVRGFHPVSIPLPIRFDFNSAQLSPIGQQAVNELLSAIQQQHPAQIILVGHTDAVGSDEYNMRLSAERLKAVERALREAGVSQPIQGVAMGKRQPLRVVDPGSLTQEDINALNRRVEWRRR
ncbi:OmpA family protein [Bradyrhizobium uaiense]|uniref:OmpA family protein n=1 Tax=Bradyrhizobium uaiense TaxID=2594946 RepID=A0A6P1B8K1_9BRAD|nr:OmpA family protein [Bradyrhizobium uaiense]NEU94693.1 OmpA family protein [Bradyrhizobium uaiense]